MTPRLCYAAFPDQCHHRVRDIGLHVSNTSRSSPLARAFRYERVLYEWLRGVSGVFNLQAITVGYLLTTRCTSSRHPSKELRWAGLSEACLATWIGTAWYYTHLRWSGTRASLLPYILRGYWHPSSV